MSAFWPSVSSRSIEEWTQGFKKLYHEPDCGRNPEEFWSAAMAHVSGIGEAIRRSHYKSLVSSAAHAFCWITCYVGKCNDGDDPLFHFSEGLSDIVALKFPDRCGHCLAIPCKCAPVEMDSSDDKDAKYKSLIESWKLNKSSQRSIDDWLKVFWSIYSGQIHLQTLESVGFHLLEEAGEEAKAVRGLVQFRGILDASIKGIDADYLKRIASVEGLVTEYTNTLGELKRATNVMTHKEALDKIDLTSTESLFIRSRLIKSKMDFVVELADTFSWLCAVQLKLLEIIDNEEINGGRILSFHVEEALKEKYASENASVDLTCYSCKKKTCKCKFFPASQRTVKATV